LATKKYDQELTGPGLYALALLWVGGAEVNFGVRALFLLLAIVIFVALAGRATIIRGVAKLPMSARIALIGVVIVPFIQLVPLPATIWSVLPGAALRTQSLAMAGLSDSWQPLSLAPVETLYTALMAVGWAAFVAASVALSGRAYRMLVLAVVASISSMVLIGVIQVMTAGSFPAFYRVSDFGSLIGTFANKNHMALAMASSLPLALFLQQTTAKPSSKPSSRRGQPDGRSFATLIFYAFLVLVGVSLPLTNSRAGLAFGFLAALFVIVNLLPKLSIRARLAVFGGIALVLLALLVSPLPTALVERFGDVADDARWKIFDRSLPLLNQFWLQGSGFGSYSALFMTKEKLEWLFPMFVNNAHNDFLQFAIEGGLPALTALFLILASLVHVLVKRWRQAPAEAAFLANSGAVILLLFGMHSIVDYPLRRPALIIVFGIALSGLYRLWSDDDLKVKR
jgi:O-antigen ligase